jgi:hypothetical protein
MSKDANSPVDEYELMMKPIDNMNVAQLRRHLSNLLRNGCNMGYQDLERLLKIAFERLASIVPPNSVPRSDFWDLSILIDPKNRSLYNRINPIEAIGALYCALKLAHVGEKDELKLSCRSGEYGEIMQIELGSFDLQNFPPELRKLCKHCFPSVISFEFFLKLAPSQSNRGVGEWSEKGEMLTARRVLNDLIIEIENMKTELQSMIEVNLPKFRKILRDPLETQVCSDNEASEDESDDGNASDDDGASSNPSKKRRKTYDEIGTNQDTPRQAVSISCNVISTGTALTRVRMREFRGNSEPHFIELLGAFSTGNPNIINSKLPKPLAPTYSDGAEGQWVGDIFKLMPPEDAVNSNTAVTQKMMDDDACNGTHLVEDYEAMQTLARALGKKINGVVQRYNEMFHFVIRTNHFNAVECSNYNVTTMSWLQKVAIGKLYLHSIAVNNVVEPAEEEEDEGEEDDASFEEEDDSEDDSDDDSCEDFYASDDSYEGGSDGE